MAPKNARTRHVVCKHIRTYVSALYTIVYLSPASQRSTGVSGAACGRHVASASRWSRMWTGATLRRRTHSRALQQLDLFKSGADKAVDCLLLQLCGLADREQRRLLPRPQCITCPLRAACTILARALSRGSSLLTPSGWRGLRARKQHPTMTCVPRFRGPDSEAATLAKPSSSHC